LRLHRAFTDRFRDEDGDLLLWLQILSVDEWLLHDAWTKQGWVLFIVLNINLNHT
jgi:hypothetical protein